jgi:hypothetical protein
MGTPVAFVRWGTDGLALVTFNIYANNTRGPAGMLYILSDSVFVSANGVPEENAGKAELVHAFSPRLNMRQAAIEDVRSRTGGGVKR